MAEVLVLCFGLLLLNAFQLWFWSRETHRLVDKVMSRNYAEYVQSNTFRAQLPLSPNEQDTEPDETEQVLEEVNRTFGL